MKEPGERSVAEVSPSDLCYAIFTSGSTGFLTWRWQLRVGDGGGTSSFVQHSSGFFRGHPSLKGCWRLTLGWELSLCTDHTWWAAVISGREQWTVKSFSAEPVNSWVDSRLGSMSTSFLPKEKASNHGGM